ncbi:MAG: DUF6786 family protein [Planctomycetota bacterium]
MRMVRGWSFIGWLTMVAMGSRARAQSFEDDLEFLKANGDVVVLKALDRQVVVSPRFQGRVMTSTPGAGLSCGYINRAGVQRGESSKAAFYNYGGEDRFWLGPEGGQFALYFPPGAKQELKNWIVPPMFGAGAWQANDVRADAVTFERQMTCVNASGVSLDIGVKRVVKLLPQDEVEKLVGALGGAQWVAFETANTITNVGKAPWTEATGAVSVWVLGMYHAAADAYVIAPYRRDAAGTIVNDEYFGKVPPDRLRRMTEAPVLLFKADGQKRSKIGLPPERAVDRIGSMDFAHNLLTVVSFTLKPGEQRFVNSMWENPQKNPFGGDVTNSYNDGPKDTGAPSDDFYELETSSPAALLKPGEALTHVHRTLHIHAPIEQLEPFAQRMFGVSLAAVRAAVNAKN